MRLQPLVHPGKAKPHPHARRLCVRNRAHASCVSLGAAFLEGNVVVGNLSRLSVVFSRSRGTLIVRRRASGAGITASAFSFTASTEQGDIADDDLSFITLLAAGFVVPGACPEAAFDVKLRALLYIITNNFGESAECHQTVPFRLVCPVAALVFGALCCRNGKISHNCAAGSGPDLRVFAHIEEE